MPRGTGYDLAQEGRRRHRMRLKAINKQLRSDLKTQVKTKGFGTIRLHRGRDDIEKFNRAIETMRRSKPKGVK